MLGIYPFVLGGMNLVPDFFDFGLIAIKSSLLSLDFFDGRVAVRFDGAEILLSLLQCGLKFLKLSLVGGPCLSQGTVPRLHYRPKW